jgi:hypothetical protein
LAACLPCVVRIDIPDSAGRVDDRANGARDELVIA